MLRKTLPVLFIIYLWHAPVVAANESPVSLQSFKTHGRLTFKLDPGVEAVWKDNSDGFQILFKGISLVDLGAPLGSEEAWSRQFTAEIKAKKDARLSEIHFKEGIDGLEVSGKWKFPLGDLAPANKKMERFDYRETDTPAYVVDFWPKAGPTVGEARAAQKKLADAVAFKKMQEEAEKRRDARLAIERARQEIEDNTPFCSRPMDETRDVFLKFNPVREKFDLSRWFSASTPDRGYSYHVPTGKDKDAQYVRLAVSLYKKTKFGLALRTIEFLESEIPNSTFMPEMQFLKANCLHKLGAEVQADRILEQVVQRYSDSPVSLQAGVYLTRKSLELGQSLASMERFLWLIDKHPAHRLSWVFHLGAAESLLALRETDRAKKEFEWVIENAPERKYQAEAAIRLGDLSMIREQYDQALSSYYGSIQKYKVESELFPSIYINRAESLYWLGQYDRAKEEYESFLKKFPNHPMGWRAAYRLGEIGSRQVAGANSADARKWFFQTVNQFPTSPGALLARIRLIPCAERGGFTPEGAKRFYETEVSQYDGGGEVVMARYHDFRGLGQMRMLISEGKHGEALDVGMHELQVNPRSEGKNIIGDTLHALMRKQVLKLIDDGKSYEALAFFNDRKSGLPKNKVDGDLVKSDYILRLSQAAADLGLGSMSQELAKNYYDIQKTETGGRAVAADAIESRLKRSAELFTEAKALWTEKGMSSEAEVLEKLAAVDEESEISYEREVLRGLLNEKSGRFASALRNVRKAQLLMPKTGTPEELAVEKGRIEFWAASLEAKAGDPRVAIESYRSMIAHRPPSGAGIRQNASATLGLSDVDSEAKLTVALGELLAGIGRWGEAALSYSKAIEAGISNNQIIYEYSRALGRSPKEADKVKSQQALESLAESNQDDFWRKLARTRLADETGKYKPKKPTAKEGSKP